MMAADPLTAQRIEILRGASTLLYGSNAVGGVVNIIDGRIPIVIPDEKISGRTRLSYGTVAEDYSGGAALNFQLGGSGDTAIMLHLDGYFRNSADYDIPGFANSDLQRAEDAAKDGTGADLSFGTVENSDVDNKGGAIGLSWIGEKALFGVSFSLNDSNYGVPGSEEDPVRIGLDQKRFDLKGDLDQEFLIFQEARLGFGYADYEHQEFEGSEVGTIFLNEGFEGRIELIQKDIGLLQGTLGLQIRKRDFEAIGEEAFVPPTKTFQWGVFVGVPGSEEDPVRIGLDQKRFDLKGDLDQEFLIFQEARLGFGYADYEHQEFEGSEVGTIFLNEGFEGRIELIQKDIGLLQGTLGLQIRKRDFEAIGEEAFVPPTKTFQWGVFAVEEWDLDPVTLEFGARFDHQSVKNKTLNITRTFNNLSLSMGAAIHPTKTSLIGLSLGRTERAPTAEELFSNGPHLATSAFEVGNVNLTEEKATSLELTLKQETDRFTLSVNLYHTWYDNFISEQFTGVRLDGLNVLEFQQRDARFYGAELESNILVLNQGDHNLWFKASGDIVRASFTNNGGNLPRIPAKSATFGFEYEGGNFGASGTLRLVDDQSKLAENERLTRGYSEINLDILWRPYGEDHDLTLRLQGKNLGNAERRVHTSFLKDLLPMPGRNIKLSVTYGF